MHKAVLLTMSEAYLHFTLNLKDLGFRYTTKEADVPAIFEAGANLECFKLVSGTSRID